MRKFKLSEDTIAAYIAGLLTREARLLTGGFFAATLAKTNPRFAYGKFRDAIIKRIDENDNKDS